MNNLAGLRRGTILAVATLLLMMPIGTVQGANSTNFAVTVIGQTLTAGFNNNVTVAVAYAMSAYSSASLYDVDLAVSTPSPLQLLGDGHWHYDSIVPGQSVAVSFEIYASTGAIGSSYDGSVTLTYRELGDISYTVETHTVTFSVHGWINLKLYGIQIVLTAAVPGGNATVSGNLLNSGNIAAYNATVTVESEAIAQGTTAYVFLGEVDTNIARPFSLVIHFGKNLPAGTYAVVVKVSAIDTERPGSPYIDQQTSQIELKNATVQQPTRFQRTGGVTSEILGILRYLLGLFFGSSTLAMSSD